jgi:hypothetical protein
VPFSVVATIMGWSASTTVRMAKRYGHNGQSPQRLAVDALCESVSRADGAQNRAQSVGMNPWGEPLACHKFLGTVSTVVNMYSRMS